VLVTGPTGSGKSSTLAALIKEINHDQSGHILTLEDPIEFIHPSQKCLINQRELGQHTFSFESALKSGLRQDPDYILVGEMRDPESIRLVLTAAETGHLVIATMNTTSAVKSVVRIIESFPQLPPLTMRKQMEKSKWCLRNHLSYLRRLRELTNLLLNRKMRRRNWRMKLKQIVKPYNKRLMNKLLNWMKLKGEIELRKITLLNN
jgi:type IV secretory pathway ATPase VirB11/archaellum biosynthesis ATPase